MYFDVLAENSKSFAAAAELGLDPQVPGCPDWNLGQLVVHLGDVYDFWGHVIEANTTDPKAVEQLHEGLTHEREARNATGFSSSPGAIAFFNDRAQYILTLLSDADPSRPSWTWWPGNQTVGFIQRRMAHETTIHRWDAQSAHGLAKPIDPPEVAADGIDENLMNELTGWPEEERSFPTASIHLHCTDAPGEWLIRTDGSQVSVTEEHAKADVALVGPASDLLLILWDRQELDSVTVHGDATVFTAFRDKIDHE